MSFVAGGYLNFPTNTGSVVIPPSGGLYSNGTAGTVCFGTNGIEVWCADSTQHFYYPSIANYSLVVQTSAGTLGGIAYGALNTTLRGQGTTSPPAFSTVTTPNTDAAGDIWIASSTNTVTALAIGTTGQHLAVVSAQPAWVGAIPTATTVNGNAPANNANTGFTFTSAYSGSPTAVLNGTALTWAPSEAVVLTTTGGLPGAFSTATTYYVNTTGLSTTTFQLRAAPPTFAGNTWTACTSISATSAGSGTHTATAGAAGNYIVQATSANDGFIVMPQGTYSGATSLKLTSSVSATHGYTCGGTDVTTTLLFTMNAFTVTSCNMAKAAAAAAGDVVAYHMSDPT